MFKQNYSQILFGLSCYFSGEGLAVDLKAQKKLEDLQEHLELHMNNIDRVIKYLIKRSLSLCFSLFLFHIMKRTKMLSSHRSLLMKMVRLLPGEIIIK